MALVCSEVDTAKFFKRSLSSFWARNIAPLNFKTERVAEIALRASSFWPTSAGSLGTWLIFSSLGDSKQTPDGLGLEWNGHGQKDGTLAFQLLGRNIAPLHFKTARVAKTALRASWFSAILARFAGHWGIFSSPGDSKVTPDGLSFNWNGHR